MLASCIFFLNSAIAGWTPFLGYSSEEPAMIYVDVEKIEKKNNIAKLWEKSVFRKMQSLEGASYKVRVTLSEYDCKKKEVKVVYGAMYKDEAMQDPLWFGKLDYEGMPITPGSYAETSADLACSYSPKRKTK